MIKLKNILNEAKPAVVGNVNAFGPSKVLGKGGKVLGFVPDTPNAIATLIQDYPNVQAIEFKSPFFFDFNSYKSIKKGDKAWKELMSRGVDKATKAALKKDFQLKDFEKEGIVVDKKDFLNRVGISSLSERHKSTPNERISKFKERIKNLQDKISKASDKNSDAVKLQKNQIKVIQQNMNNFKQAQTLKKQKSAGSND